MVANLVLAAIAVAVVALAWLAGRIVRGRRAPGAAGDAPRDKGEALFVSMFPELQPHFHPENLVAYVAARRGRTPSRDGFTWKNAPGFGGLPVDIRFAKDGEECALLGATGLALAKFRYEGRPDGAVIRHGDGKFTVDLGNARDPAVRYWHPEREFQWTRLGGWRFKTPVAESPFVSSDRVGDSGPSISFDDSGAQPSAFAGGGGTFDGGGASGGWGAQPAGGEPGSPSDTGDAAGAGDPGTDAGGGADSGSDSGSGSGSTSY